MNRSLPQEPRPSLLIDLKKNRIRIHKTTLHLLGDPDYIQFLVNPENMSIVIRSSLKNDYLSHHIRWNLISGKQCCDFYSYFLLKSLRAVNYDWEENRSYRLYGHLHRRESLAMFSMKEFVDIDEIESSEKETS